ncbi:L,D-transpeptidase family protein [Streptomyces durbertensis]|uniref:L,D-transpeptidase family protein n=1 Tax=Streptomyces durbertensis TaxID=2448886 RepID=A0ABR6EFK1_9ACTN|nr:Ig-like domain-containing protein [Streptomyces durbertensis]MBB1244105.1 L,D-transpeptidase family protein [Streptomyces durbertensis]
MRNGTNGTRRAALGCALLVPVMSLTACGGGSSHPLAADPYDAAGHVGVSAGGAPADSRPVDPEKAVEITAEGDNGQLTDVTVTDERGRHLAGELSADGRRWRSTGALAAGATYTVRVSTENRSGRPGRGTLTFDTATATKARKLRVEFGPESGTYGVGQPVTAELSRAVKRPEERRIVEAALHVRSTPKVRGAWHWVDDKKLHYRPKEYWPSGAAITVESTLAGLKVRDGLYGARSQKLKLRTGDRVEAVADASSLEMTVSRNGEVVRTIPITTGKAGFRTRNGTKVVLGQESFVRMRSTSIGIGAGSPDYYDLPVYWATRLTWSGEYVHGAPWSSGSHGWANVSHGCTGMSTENAQWVFNTFRPGDLVTHTNTEGTDMAPFGNGFGDWNLSWEKWLEGSALHAPAKNGGDHPEAAKARLRPSL